MKILQVVWCISLNISIPKSVSSFKLHLVYSCDHFSINFRQFVLFMIVLIIEYDDGSQACLHCLFLSPECIPCQQLDFQMGNKENVVETATWKKWSLRNELLQNDENSLCEASSDNVTSDHESLQIKEANIFIHKWANWILSLESEDHSKWWRIMIIFIHKKCPASPLPCTVGNSVFKDLVILICYSWSEGDQCVNFNGHQD